MPCCHNSLPVILSKRNSWLTMGKTPFKERRSNLQALKERALKQSIDGLEELVLYNNVNCLPSCANIQTLTIFV